MLRHRLTPNADLRALEPWLAAEFAAYVHRAREHLAPWLPWARTIVDEETARQFLQRYADQQAADGGRIQGIWLDGELVGGTLFRIFDPRTSTCEIGVWLAREAQGHGLIQRTARLMIDWAVHERGMNRVEWRTFPANTRSIAVAQRLGMKREGMLREAFPMDGVGQDIEVWSILAAEWRAAANPPVTSR